MKKTTLILITICFGIFISCNSKDSNSKTNYNSQEKFKFQNGDVIFQTSQSRQSKAIQLATNSKYSHVGIIYNNSNKLYVFEAVQPVKITPLESWINRGKNKHYVVKRLINSNDVLDSKTISKMKQAGEKYLNKNYDIYFEWTDDKIYCSELVWKIYKEAANIEIGELEKLSDFDLTNNIVREILKERYGNNIPMDEVVISPESIYNSDLLETIYKN